VSTPIEDFLYNGQGVHAVVEFTQSSCSIRLKICPWDEINNESPTEAIFDLAKITSIDVYAVDVDDLNLPWDIIGMDCYKLDQKRWQFVLHFGGIEYAFESEWPTVTKL
jgi:hypothetical protein